MATKQADFEVQPDETLVLIRPLTETATKWLDETVEAEPAQYVDGGLVVGRGLAFILVFDILDAGFVVRNVNS